MSLRKEEIKQKIETIRDNRQINIIVTSLLIFLSSYLAFVTCLNENLLHPLAISSETRNLTEFDLLTLSKDGENIKKSSISVFFIVVLGLIVGRGFFYLHLPPLLGSLLVGIGLRNIPVINEWLYIDSEWDTVLRKLAFALIMIRCSIGINLQVVRAAPRILISLGVIGPLIESLAVFLAAHFLFNFPRGISVVFGFLLAATSPAVTVPSMLRLQNAKYGTKKGIPSLILACASADNVLLIVAYTVSMGILFAQDSMLNVMMLTIGEIIGSVVIGLMSGFVLWWLPRPNDTYTHLSRAILLITLSCAQLFIAIRINIEFTGSISLVVTCLVAAFQWKRDNQKQILIEQRSFGTLWDLIFQPVLFVLIGMKFEIIKLSPSSLLIGLSCLLIGVFSRAIAIFLLTLRTSLRFSEQLVFIFSFLPKATVQAALAPSIVLISTPFPSILPFVEIILSASVIAILVTAPLGQLALDLFGEKLLHLEDQKESSTNFGIKEAIADQGIEDQVNSPKNSSISSLNDNQKAKNQEKETRERENQV
ncbi:unnamed protein product, partial [Mesorhabditis belari]|uniref:Cation/H+ exchanger domain-containing protein n=1 Tax=Mesorhabditis belari TaxID=2138241 RepID=A0AAF3EXS9_9BILA